MFLAYPIDGFYCGCGLREAKHHLLRFCQYGFFIKCFFFLKNLIFSFFLKLLVSGVPPAYRRRYPKKIWRKSLLLAYKIDGFYRVCGLREAKHHLLRLCQSRFFIKYLFLLKTLVFRFFWATIFLTWILVPPAYIFWKNMFLEKCTPAVLKKVFKKLKGFFFRFFKKKDKNNDFFPK